MLVRIFIAIATLLDSVLSHFVTAINVTTQMGNETAGSIATIINLGSQLYAQILIIFTSITT